MSTQYIALASVYTGSWINWTDGFVKGSTLTTSSRDGGILIAFLAWFVGVASSAFWDLLSNLIFLSRATEAPKDALFHQQQMSLRVGASDFGILWTFWKLGRHWHHRAKCLRSRSWPIMLTASINIALFSAAGILVSKVTQTRSDVILKSTVCGLWDDPWAGDTLVDTVTARMWASQQQQILNLAGNYVSSCYTFNKSENVQQSCLAYGQSNLAWNVTTKVRCPFSSEMCIHGKSVLLDSGLIDSQLHLGINGRIKDRVQYRQQMHCSPLETEEYVFRTSNISDPRLPKSGFATTNSPELSMFPPPGTAFLGFKYGTNTLMTFGDASGASGYNVTYVYNNYTFGLPGTNVASTSYLFDTEIAFLNSPDHTFVPIPQLEQTDADLSIVFLINQALYEGPVEDPWFQALIPVTGYNSGPTVGTVKSLTYVSALPASPMGCITRHQWCKDEGKICTALSGNAIGGRNSSREATIQELRLNSRQKAILNRINTYVWTTSLYFTTNQVNADILLADEQSSQLDVPALPENQWMLEVDHWFGLGLTAIQLQNVNYVLGDGRPSHDKYMKPVEGDGDWMCHNQIVQRDDFTSFSILGIALIFFIGGLFITLDVCLEPVITFWYHKVQPRKVWKLRAWRGNRPLQIQSQAFEAKGLGTWEQTTGDVPVTEQEELFVNPFSIALRQDTQIVSEPKNGHWWQRKGPWGQRSDDQSTNDQEAGQRQNNVGAELQTATSILRNPRELLPPMQKSIFQSFEMEFSQMSNSPRPGYDRLYTTDTEATLRNGSVGTDSIDTEATLRNSSVGTGSI